MNVQTLECPLPIEIGASRPPTFDVYRQLRNLTANLTAYIFRTKHETDNRETARKPLETYVVPSSHELWPTNAENRVFVLTHPA